MFYKDISIWALSPSNMEKKHMIELDDGWWVTRDYQTSQFTGDYDHP